LGEWTLRLAELGASVEQRARIVRSLLAGRALDQHAQSPHGAFNRRLLAALPRLQAELDGLARVVERAPSADGGERLLIQLADGATVESVLLPLRGGLCLSTQVGCAVGCRFCKTGEGGLLRNLTGLEIALQLALARRTRAVERAVFMGMGEPAHNLANVLEACEWFGREGRLAHKHLVFSTVGERKVFPALLAAPVRPALALSLHTTRAKLREELLPRAPRIAIAELVALACDYAEAVTWPLQVQWTLLAGVNDALEEADALAGLLAGRLAMVNAIEWNPNAGQAFERASPDAARAFLARLRAAGVIATLRASAAQDVEGGCGQLRSRSLAAQA
jgi:23S rRNA (adenine2503-C2)-methyltransferase